MAPVESTSTALVVVEPASMPRKHGPGPPPGDPAACAPFRGGRGKRQLLLVLEQRPEPVHVLRGHVAQAARPVQQHRRADRRRVAGGERGAHGDKELPLLGHPHRLRFQAERLDEQPARLGKEVEGTAQERHRAADGLPARQARDGLVHHRLEDAGRNVFPARPFVDERLDVRLGKDAASRRDGVDGRVAARQLVQAGGVRGEQARHLVDEGARAAGAGAVHPLLQAAGEIGDLGVLPAQLDGHVRVGQEPPHRAGTRRSPPARRAARATATRKGRRTPSPPR